MTYLPYNKIIDIADFDDPVLLPHLRDIARGEMQRFGLSEPVIIPDSKQWECAMMLRTLSEHGVLQPGAKLAGIGAGTEETTFALAAKGSIVFPSDRYLEQTPWSDVAPASMMVRPAQYSQFSYDRGAVIPVHSDARVLSLPSNFFDGVYSAGSIEHFGSLDAVAAAAEEIGRVLKPGGIAVLATEFRLDGPNDRPWFSDDCILFTPALLQDYIVAPSGLELIGDVSFTTSPKTFDTRTSLIEFLEKAKRVGSLTDKRNAYPNLVLYHQGFLFCSVHLALRKLSTSRGGRKNDYSARFEADVAAQATRTSGILCAQIEKWTGAYDRVTEVPRTDLASLDQVVRQYETELASLRQSRSFRYTRPLRDAANFVRATPALRELARAIIRVLRAIKRLIR